VHLWCLYDKRTNRTIEGLLFDEARAYISNLQSDELENWYVWKEDWPDWRSANEVEGLTEMIYRALHVSPPPPPKSIDDNSQSGVPAKVSTKTEPSIRKIMESNQFHKDTSADKTAEPKKENIDEFSKTFSTTTGNFVLRSQRRFNKRMSIVITGDAGQTFKTFTKDISVGGMYFEHSIPDWVSGYFNVRVSKPNSKQQIEITCCLIENQKEGEKFRVSILPFESEEDAKNLETWLAA
jgi:PilZ domain